MRKTIRKNVPLNHEGVRSEYSVFNDDGTYVVEVTIRTGWTRVNALRARFDKPANGTIATYAHEWAKRIITDAKSRSERTVFYVRIEDFPGFAEEELPGLVVRAHYDGLGGKPVYVAKVNDQIAADRIATKVDGLVINDGPGRQWTPRVTQVTSSALAALAGDVSGAEDPETYFAALREQAAAKGATA